MSSPEQRTAAVAAQLGSPESSARQALRQRLPTDVVICSAVRTPFTRAKKGGLRDTFPEDLLVAVFEAAVERAGPNMRKELVEEIQVGNCLPPGGGASVARMAQLAGFPTSSTVGSLNRQCSSGLTAINYIALQIMANQIDIGIGAGCESMSMGSSGHGASAIFPEKLSPNVMANQQSADCTLPMGLTSENVAKAYNVSREAQDTFAAASYQRAQAAQEAGKFKDEITPVKTTLDGRHVIILEDDGIRKGVTRESLAKLKPAFSKEGSTHAGNASQISDGASAVLLARRSVAQALGLPVLGKFCAATVAGVEPKLMGIGPAFAIPKLLSKLGLSIDDVDLFEINEAFASQAIMSIETLKIPYEKVNPVGGAIALGHPLGATGARQIATALSECKRNGQTVFCTSMCLGSGMGMAALFTSEQ